MSSLLEQLAQAYMAKERQRLGIPDQEAKAAAEARAAKASDLSGLLHQAELERIKQQMSLAPAMQEAQIRNLDEPNRLPPQPHADQTEVQILANGNIGIVNRTTKDVKDTGVKAHIKQAGGGGAAAGAGVQITTSEGKPAIYYPTKTAGGVANLPEGAAFASDIRGARKEAVAATAPLGTVETLADQLDTALSEYEHGSWLHPIDKAVAQSNYKNLLSALSVPWGRLLGDTRISNEDRASYSRSVGEPGVFLKEMAPDLARRRLENLRRVLESIRAKYGSVLEGTSGMLAPVGGGAKLLGGSAPTTVDPQVQRILDMIKERNARP